MFWHTTEFKPSCFLMVLSLDYCEELGVGEPLGTETQQGWAVLVSRALEHCRLVLTVI